MRLTNKINALVHPAMLAYVRRQYAKKIALVERKHPELFANVDSKVVSAHLRLWSELAHNPSDKWLRMFAQISSSQDYRFVPEDIYYGVVERLKQIYPSWEQDKNLIVKPYFDNMVSVLKASDIVISRAGSLSLSEICASHVAPILVPYPHAAANHQRINAKSLLENGACVYIEDAELEPNKLREIIVELINNPVKMNYLKQNSSYLAKYDAANQIADLMKKIASDK